MSSLGTAIAIILIILVVMTAISEPKITFEYGKALVLSGKKLVEKVIHLINDVTEDENETRRHNESISG